jgi:glycosyltransferase involved in cell wall biosynthesis
VRIGIDVRYLSHGLIGGVRTYVYHLARELPALASSHELVYYADEKGPFELKELAPNVQRRVMPWSSMLSSVSNDITLGRWAERDKLDLLHSPANYGPASRVTQVVTIHDSLNLFPFSQHLRGFGRRPRQVAMMWYLGMRTRQSLSRAHHVVVPSEYSRQDIARRSGRPLDHMSVVFCGASELFRPADPSTLADCAARHRLAQRYVIADGIKNPDAVVSAYRQLPEELQRSVQLVFFSREDTPRPAVRNALADVTEPSVRFISRPSTPELSVLLAGAEVFLFPSFYEGFGIPLAEAMRCGTPIVASDRACIPEVVGDAGLFASLEDPAALGHQMRRVLEDEPLRRALAQRSLARGPLFDWRSTAAQMLAVYERVGTRA